MSNEAPTPKKRSHSGWFKIFIVLSVFGFLTQVIGDGCRERKVKRRLHEELANYMDVASVTVGEDSVISYSPEGHHPVDRDVSFEAVLADGKTISGSARYWDYDYQQNPKTFLIRAHLDGDGLDWVRLGDLGSQYQLKTKDSQFDATEPKNVITANKSDSNGSLKSELKSANQYFVNLHENGMLPGCPKDEHGVMQIETDQTSDTVSYPMSVEFNLSQNGAHTTNNYIIIRSSREQQWQLIKAWQTDKDGNTVNEWISR